MIGTLKSIIGIIDWITKRYDATKEQFKEWRRKAASRRIRRAVDSLDTDTIDDLMRKIKQKRRDRHDGS